MIVGVIIIAIGLILMGAQIDKLLLENLALRIAYLKAMKELEELRERTPEA